MSDRREERPTCWQDDALVYALIALAWLGLWMGSRQWVFLAPLAVVFALHPLLKNRVRFDPGVVVYAVVALLVALVGRFVPVKWVGGGLVSSSFYACLLALSYAALKLYSPPDRSRLPRMVFYSAVACGFVASALPDYLGNNGNSILKWKRASPLGPLTPDPRVFYAALTCTFGVLALVALRRALRERRADPRGTAPRARWVGVGISAALVAGLTYGGVQAEERYYEDVSRLYADLLSGSASGGGGGFSNEADLNSVTNARSTEAREIALRVFAPREPGYLRAKAFEDYGGRRWHVSWPDVPGSSFPDRFELPGRRSPADGEEPFLVVHPSSKYVSEFFLPLEACAVDTTSGTLAYYSPGSTLRSLGEPTSRGYAVYLNDRPVHDDSLDPVYTKLPDDPELLAALDRMLADLKLEAGAPPLHARDVIYGQLRMKFKYELGVNYGGGARDPLIPFLLEGKKGHCELFASAGTLLLRRLGIPARYVTGYVCVEPNSISQNLFVARNSCAHAWSEVYTKDQGWQVAEFTPDAGVPDPKPARGSEAFFEWLGSVWDRLTAFLLSLPGAIGGAIGGAVAWLVGAWWRMALLAAVVALVVFLRRKVRAPGGAHRRQREFTGELAAQREHYLEFEGRLRSAGLGRHDWETLLEYARRLEPEAFPEGVSKDETLAFLRTFAMRRYEATSEGS